MLERVLDDLLDGLSLKLKNSPRTFLSQNIQKKGKIQNQLIQ